MLRRLSETTAMQAGTSTRIPRDRDSVKVSKRRLTAIVIGLAVLGHLFVGCGPSTQTGDLAVDRRPPNIVFFVIDTLRADRLGAYGYEEMPTSPRIDGLARQGILFGQAYAPAPWTLPSVASMFSGAFLCEHGVITDRSRLSEEYETLAEHLKASGYRTLGLTGNPYVGADFGLAQGFDELTFSRRNDAAKVAPLLDRTGDGPFFLYIHNMEPHGGERYLGPQQSGFPDVAEPLREQLLEIFRDYRRLTRVDFRANTPLGTTDNTNEQIARMAELDAEFDVNSSLYDAAVRLADERVGSVIDLLVERGVWDDTLFVLLSDHGEELADHGGWQHDQSVYEELVHVPLVVKVPGGARAGDRVEEPFSLVDVAPLIYDLAGLPAGSSSVGSADRLAVVNGSGDVRTPMIPAVRINRKKYFRPWKDSRGDVNVVVRDGRWKAIWNAELGTVELYDLVDDPGETTDLAARQPDLSDKLLTAAAAWLETCGAGGLAENTGLSDDTTQRLRALGYVE